MSIETASILFVLGSLINILYSMHRDEKKRKDSLVEAKVSKPTAVDRRGYDFGGEPVQPVPRRENSNDIFSQYSAKVAAAEPATHLNPVFSAN